MFLKHSIKQFYVAFASDRILHNCSSSECRTNEHMPWFLSKVHIRVASPPIRYPCFMGINIPTKEELIANKPEFEHISDYLGKYQNFYKRWSLFIF